MKTLFPTIVFVAVPLLATAAEPQQLEGFQEKARVVALSPDGNTLLAVGLQPDRVTLKAFDVQNNTSRVVVEASTPFQPFVSNDSTRLAWFDSRASSLNVVDVKNGRRLAELRDDQPRSSPDELRFAPDKKTLFEARRTQPVRAWETASAKELGIIGDESAGHMWVDLTPDGEKLLVAGTDVGKFLGTGKGLVQVWNPASLKLLSAMELQPETRICVMARISPDGKSVVAAELGRAPRPQLTLWDAATGKRRALLDEAVDMQLVLASGRVDTGLPIVFTADGQWLATMTTEAVKIWQTSSGELKHTLPVEKGTPLMIAAAPAGAVLAVSYGDPLPPNLSRQPPLAEVSGKVQLWDAPSGELLVTLDGSVPYPKTLVFAGNGSRLAAASYTRQTGPGRIYVWDVREWVPESQLPAATAVPVVQPEPPPATPTPPSPQPVKFEPRTWSDSTGKFQVNATFVALEGRNVKLKRADNGQVIAVPLNRLSKDDRRIALELGKKLPGARNEP